MWIDGTNFPNTREHASGIVLLMHFCTENHRKRPILWNWYSQPVLIWLRVIIDQLTLSLNELFCMTILSIRKAIRFVPNSCKKGSLLRLKCEYINTGRLVLLLSIENGASDRTSQNPTKLQHNNPIWLMATLPCVEPRPLWPSLTVSHVRALDPGEHPQRNPQPVCTTLCISTSASPRIRLSHRRYRARTLQCTCQ